MSEKKGPGQTPTKLLPVATTAPETVEPKSVLRTLDPTGQPRVVRLADLAEEAPLPDLKQGAGKYEIIGELGAGGMGKVYLAYDQDLQRRVALKMMKRSSPDGVRRFLEEAQVMAQLDHPYIVPVHEVGLTNGRPFYTMRVVHGESLARVLAAARAGHAETLREYSLARRMQLFIQVGQALSYAHARGVIHRDVKPSNVMLGQHGQVQVMDWGLAKVLREGSVVTTLGGPATRVGHVFGTPHYMSPEQAQGQAVDHMTDIYSLGVMLYELLTLARPFDGTDVQVMTAIVRDEPAAPRSRAADAPAALESVCLAALAKAPANRPATVAEMLRPVQEWLEAEADRAKRHELAEAKAGEGREKLEEYGRLKRECARLEEVVEEVSGRFEPWQPAAQKKELITSRQAVSTTQSRLVEVASSVVETLERALEYEDDHAKARELLADYYWDRYLDAEARFDARDMLFFSSRVARYHDGKYARELKQDGSLRLTSNPPGAEVWLHDLVEEGFAVVERNARKLGTTPLSEVPLPTGSYLAVLKKDGYQDTRYPVLISRNRSWTGSVELYTEDAIGSGFVYVPAGPFVMGADSESSPSGPRAEPEVGDFFIAEHPLTQGEYLEFLNDLARIDGLDAARGQSPRAIADDPRTSYLEDDGEGGLRLPEDDAEGDEWHPRFPLFSISHQDAVAYCAWRSARDGRAYRLPTETEWEKAARGVDGRWFPWGWWFDASLTNMRESFRDRSTPVPVEEFPGDVSVYGVRGLGGNVRDWTATEVVRGIGPRRRVFRVGRGGSWVDEARNCRAASHNWHDPANVDTNLGFRLARSPR